MAQIDPSRLLAFATWLVLVGSVSVVVASTGQQCACGIRQSTNQSVVAGELIEPGEWPWHVGIYWWRGSKLNPPDRVCEGALLDPDGLVLTAASCLKDANGELLRMGGMVGHVGLVALQQKTKGSRKFQVENVTFNDELDLALVLLKVEDEWEGMPVCLNDELERWDEIYGKPVHLLQQTHRSRLGGFEIVKIGLEKEVTCYGSTMAVKGPAVADSTIKLKTRGTSYQQSARGTPLYILKAEGWTLLGISAKVKSSIPEALCHPGDYESFLNINVPAVHAWIFSEFDGDSDSSVETSTE
ncbi:serine protease 28-like [Topomyia yanbarensis]|uniref:serine protease 28-like n=1 Tax=Topomyia yanbarensis TaxID=2498891 RepID=UPI00273A9DCC|nr:serine protease 28-like [Topomyia yanbarensis]